MKSLQSGQKYNDLRTNITALAQAVLNLDAALPSEDAAFKTQMQAYYEQMMSQAELVAQNGEAAFRLREAGAPRPTPAYSARPAPRRTSGKTTRSKAPGKVQTDPRKLVRYEIQEIEGVETGVGADEEVLLPCGGSKKIAELEVGDCVLNELGEVKKVLRAPVIVHADGVEVTLDSTAMETSLLTRQGVIVAAGQPLEVTVRQFDIQRRPLERLDRKPSVCQSYKELVTTVKRGEWEITKPWGTSASVSYSEDGTLQATTEQEANDLLDAKLEERNVPDVLRYFVGARHVVRYKKPEKGPLECYFAAANIDEKTRCMVNTPTGLIMKSPEAGLSPERMNMDRMLEHLSVANRKEMYFMAGAWVGDGNMNMPYIAADSIDTEFMVKCAEFASKLELCCDILYQHFTPDEREMFSGKTGTKDVSIHLSDSNGLTETGKAELELFHDIISERTEKAKEWRATHKWQGGFNENPYDRNSAKVIFYNGWLSNGWRNLKDNNLFWRVFQQMRATRSHGELVKAVPLWLATVDVELREAFLAGLIESDGSREKGDLYRVTTIYPEVRDGAVALGRSLGITTNAYQRIRDREGLIQQTEFVVSFRGCDATRRVASQVATPRKLPHSAPEPDWVREPKDIAFTVTPKGPQRIATGFEVEGHRLLMKSFLVVLDANAGSLDVQKKRRLHIINDTCLAKGCGKFDSHYGPSWNNAEGKLCGMHWQRFKKTHVYCSGCKDVPENAAGFPYCKVCEQNTLVKAEPDRKQEVKIIRE